MTSERDNCGFSSFLPMSCRERAEAFAKHLNSRLQSLGSQDGLINNENTWRSANESSVAVSQPRSSDSDSYFDFGILESPGTPEEHKLETELTKLVNSNKDEGIRRYSNEGCVLLKDANVSNSVDSDSSDGPYYDPETDDKVLLVNTINDAHLSDVHDEVHLNDTKLLIAENGADTHTEVYEDEGISSAEKLEEEEEEEEEPESECTRLLNSNLHVDITLRYDEDETEADKEEQEEEREEEKSEPVAKQSCGIDDTNDEDLERIPRVRRCSSLKTGKTPPGTPGRKKIVRFADVLGLDLADVRTFLDEIPKIPHSAYDDLTGVDITSSCSDTSLNSMLGIDALRPKSSKVLVPLFQQPGGQANFLERVKNQQVCLENAMVEDIVSLSIKGTVRVRNLDFNKSVHIRYTLDAWKSYADLQAAYLQNSCDGFSDKFSFLLYAHTLTVGQRLEFAIRFQCKGFQFWDNNFGTNYCFQCLPTSNNSPFKQESSVEEHFGAAFY